MLQMDEDANLEPPKMRQTHSHQYTQSPLKRHHYGNKNAPLGCYHNDWMLRTKLKINFLNQCKNWDQNSSTTHKRHNGLLLDDDSPTKSNDKTISIEAIKNAATVYQHPYFSWLPLYPRRRSEFDHKKTGTFALAKHSQAIKLMHKDWCESLDDLTNLLIDGRCPFFYICSDNYNILFRNHNVAKMSNNSVDIQAFISPISYGMSSLLKKIGIQIDCNDDSGIENDSSLDEVLGEDFGEDENEDASQFLESIGLSQQDFPSLQMKRKGFLENDSNSQSTKSASNKPLATIEGVDNIRKLVKFLQTNQTYTISSIGEFACIPPTLLAPREFRLSTPQYPEVILSKNNNNNVDAPPTPPRENNVQISKQTTEVVGQQQGSQSVSTSTSSMTATTKPIGPTFVELRGTILPNLYKKLHKLLTVSDNMDHTCSSTHLDSSTPFGSIQFS